jgi:hypothetical protein
MRPFLLDGRLMRRTFVLAAAAATVGAAACRGVPSPSAPAISTHELAADVRFLADDAMEGRGPGTRADVLAQTFLATRLQAAGCEPAGENGGWTQSVPILGITSTVTRTLRAVGDGEREFAAPEEFTAVAGSPEAAAAWQGAELVFVGFGIHAPEQRWDDFGDVDLRGKVLLVMNSDPADDPERFGGKTRLYYGRWSYKFEEAARRGAVGAIIIHTNESAGYPFQVVQANHGRENFWLPFAAGTPTLGIRSWCTETAAHALCKLGGHDLDRLREGALRGGQAPVALGVKLDLSIANAVREFRSANVVGAVRGSDPALADQYVVVTAHFDHLGIGKPRGDDAIYNGAVDNASGCAGALSLARAIAADRPRRSVLFAFVTAEESGLLGSQHFCAQPTVPADRMVANYNVDGLNVWGATRDLEFIGYGKNSLSALAERIAATRGRTITPDSNPDLGLFYRSDHFNFARIGVPAAYFKAGREFYDRPEDRRRMKNSYTTVHYHQPTDELAAWWNFEGAVADLELIHECLLATANADDVPTWTPGDEFEKARRN